MSGEDCVTNLTSDQVYSAIALSGLSFFSFIISILGVALGLHEYFIKNRISDLRTERLLLYLTCIAMIFSFFGSFQFLARLVHKSSIANTGCTILGYLWFTFATLYLVFIFCLGTHFLMLICRPKILNVTREEKIKKSKNMEIIYVLCAVLVALGISPWPFLNHLYGFNLWICWIDTMRSDCSIIEIGVIETTVFYIALLLVYVYSFGVVIIVQILIWLRKRNIANLYVWIFSTHLIIGLIIIILVMIINLLPQDIVPAGLRAIKILAIPTLPLTLSLVTTVAVVCKKYMFFKNYTQKNKSNDERVINETTPILVTIWKSPPTGTNQSSAQTGIVHYHYNKPSTKPVYSGHPWDYQKWLL